MLKYLFQVWIKTLSDMQFVTLRRAIRYKHGLNTNKMRRWIQKQPSSAVLGKGVLEILLQSNFIEITLRHECSPVNLLPIFRTTFSKFSTNSSGRCLLWIHKRWLNINKIKLNTYCIKETKFCTTWATVIWNTVNLMFCRNFKVALEEKSRG